MNILKIVTTFVFILSVIMIVKPIKNKYKDNNEVKMIKSYWIIAFGLFLLSIVGFSFL